LEEMLDVPFISDTIGRFIKVTDKGLREKGEKVLEPVAQAEATQRIEVKTSAGKTAGLLLDLARQKITEDEAREKMKTLYTDAETQAIAIDALTGKGYFDKRLEAAIVRGGGTATLKMLEGAKSKAQEMTLLQYILGGEAPLPPEDHAFFWQPAFWNSETTNDKKSP